MAYYCYLGLFPPIARIFSSCKPPPQKIKYKKKKNSSDSCCYLTFCCFKPLPRVSFCEIPIQIGHISFGILESLIDSYNLLGKNRPRFESYYPGKIFFGIRSPVSFGDTIRDKKQYQSEKYSVLPTVIH